MSFNALISMIVGEICCSMSSEFAWKTSNPALALFFMYSSSLSLADLFIIGPISVSNSSGLPIFNSCILPFIIFNKS